MAYQSDWALLRAALPDLQAYILSGDLYWPLRLTATTPGSLQIPQLTLGSLRLSLARLSALPLDAPLNAELKGITQQVEKIQAEWRSNWSRKAGREFASRMNLWEQYLRELRGDARAQAAFYPNEVRHRAILALLLPDILEGIPSIESGQLEMLDNLLHGLTRPGNFVWEPELANGFPQEEYWFLYLIPKK